jgi:hypothetical protein
VNTNELLIYIQTQHAQGRSLESLTTELIAQGWQRQQIIEAYTKLGFTSKIDQSPYLPASTSHRKLIVSISLALIFFLIGAMTYYISTYKKTPSLAPQVPSPTFLTKKPIATAAPTSITPQTPGNETECGNAPMNLLTKTGNHSPALSCFITASKTCNQAQVTITGTGFGETSSTQYKILGIQQGKCGIQIVQGPITMTSTSSIPKDQQQVVEQALQKRVGREGTCFFTNNTDIAEVFTNWQDGTFSIPASNDPRGVFSKGSCSGSYFLQN